MLWWVVFNVDKAHAVALHHYSKNFRGFLAMLTPEQSQKLVRVSFSVL